MENEKFEKMKRTVQNILDKHLPPDKTFSVMNFDKEQIWYICRLLLEKDPKKRKLIFDEIDEKIKKMQYEYEMDFSDIKKHKEIFDNYINNYNDMQNLLDEIEIEKAMDNELENI